MTTKSDVKNTVDEVQDELANQKDKAVEKAKQIKDKAQEVQENVSSYIKDNPLKAIGLGILAGIGLSALMSWGKR